MCLKLGKLWKVYKTRRSTQSHEKNNKAKNREVFVETGGLYGPWPSPHKHNVFCIKFDNGKLIYNDTPQTWEFYAQTNIFFIFF